MMLGVEGTVFAPSGWLFDVRPILGGRNLDFDRPITGDSFNEAGGGERFSPKLCEQRQQLLRELKTNPQIV